MAMDTEKWRLITGAVKVELGYRTRRKKWTKYSVNWRKNHAPIIRKPNNPHPDNREYAVVSGIPLQTLTDFTETAREFSSRTVVD
jgi:hypothetical protein